MKLSADRTQDVHFVVDKHLLKGYFTADQYHTVVKMTNTEIVEKFKHVVGDSICKVEFHKTPDATAVAEKLMKAV